MHEYDERSDQAEERPATGTMGAGQKSSRMDRVVSSEEGKPGSSKSRTLAAQQHETVHRTSQSSPASEQQQRELRRDLQEQSDLARGLEASHAALAAQLEAARLQLEQLQEADEARQAAEAEVKRQDSELQDTRSKAAELGSASQAAERRIKQLEEDIDRLEKARDEAAAAQDRAQTENESLQ